jgi:hypothetical protein
VEDTWVHKAGLLKGAWNLVYASSVFYETNVKKIFVVIKKMEEIDKKEKTAIKRSETKLKSLLRNHGLVSISLDFDDLPPVCFINTPKHLNYCAEVAQKHEYLWDNVTTPYVFLDGASVALAVPNRFQTIKLRFDVALLAFLFNVDCNEMSNKTKTHEPLSGGLQQFFTNPNSLKLSRMSANVDDVSYHAGVLLVPYQFDPSKNELLPLGQCNVKDLIYVLLCCSFAYSPVYKKLQAKVDMFITQEDIDRHQTTESLSVIKCIFDMLLSKMVRNVTHTNFLIKQSDTKYKTLENVKMNFQEHTQAFKKQLVKKRDLEEEEILKTRLRQRDPQRYNEIKDEIRVYKWYFPDSGMDTMGGEKGFKGIYGGEFTGLTSYIGLIKPTELDYLQNYVREMNDTTVVDNDKGDKIRNSVPSKFNVADRYPNTIDIKDKSGGRFKYFFGTRYSWAGTEDVKIPKQDEIDGQSISKLMGLPGWFPVAADVEPVEKIIEIDRLFNNVYGIVDGIGVAPDDPNNHDNMFNQIAYNHYHNQCGLGQHIDDKKFFERPIFTIKIFGPARLSFNCVSAMSSYSNETCEFYVPMEAGTLSKMEGIAAGDIVPKKAKPGLTLNKLRVRHIVRGEDIGFDSGTFIIRRITPYALCYRIQSLQNSQTPDAAEEQQRLISMLNHSRYDDYRAKFGVNDVAGLCKALIDDDTNITGVDHWTYPTVKEVATKPSTRKTSTRRRRSVALPPVVVSEVVKKPSARKPSVLPPVLTTPRRSTRLTKKSKTNDLE